MFSESSVVHTDIVDKPKTSFHGYITTLFSLMTFHENVGFTY